MDGHGGFLSPNGATVQMDIGIPGKDLLEPIRRFRQRLKRINPRIRKVPARNQGELPTISANIHNMPAIQALQQHSVFRARRRSLQ